MKFLITLMLVGTAIGYECGIFSKDQINGDALLTMANSALTNPYKSDMDEVLAIVEKYTECDVLAGAVGVTQTDNCKPLFDAGFCFGAEAVDVVSTTWDAYNDLMGDIKNVANLACADASDCADEVITWATDCFGHNSEADYMEMGQELANYYEDNYVETVKKMAESTESNTLIKQLLDIVMEKFTSFDSIVAFAKEHMTEAVEADAEAKKAAFLGIASAFCDAGCVGKTVDFVEDITDAMAASSMCKDAAMFCGKGYNGCKRSANTYIKNNDLPCCLYVTITDVIEQVEDLILTYGESATAAYNTAYEAMDNSAKTLWKSYAAIADSQWVCIKATWAITKGKEPVCA